ncbi:MAG: hypothetical protein IJ658_05375 [Kiritimatiellae bacterium]|nr:hypothetical protein [Kiritimatiellia bacterium]
MKLRQIVLWTAVVATLAGLLYAPTGSFGFLHIDDHDYTFRCPFVFDGLSWANVKEAFANVRHGGVWMPLTYISYMAGISLFGPGPGAHHLANAALHAVNVALLMTLAWRLAGHGMEESGGTAALRRGHGFWIVSAAAFWALHPQRVEAVAWIAGRKELLWAGFALAGLLCWERGARGAARPGQSPALPPGQRAARPLWPLAGAYLCCALACMSKPTAMCFPLLALCVDLAMRKGGESATARGMGGEIYPPRGKVLMRELRSRMLAYLPLALMAIATGAIAIYSQTHPEGHEARALFSASLPWRLLNAAVAIGLSLFQMIVPAGIHLDYRAVPGQWPIHGILGCLTLAGCLAACAWRLARARHRRESGKANVPAACAPAAGLWFIAALLPTLGVFGSFGEHARADRFLYVPMMAVALAAAGWRRERENRSLRATRPIIVLLLTVLAACTWPVIDSYRSDEAAFARTLEFDPDNGRALAHVGQAECARRGGIDRGIEHLRRSQAVRPRDDTAAQLAYALAMRGHSADFDEIRRLCGKFACDHQLDRKGQALEALGMTAMRQRRWDEAIACLYDSIRAPQRFYSNEDAMLKLAACLCNAGRQKEAARWLEQLAGSKRADIRGKAIQSLETLRRNPRAVLFLD